MPEPSGFTFQQYCDLPDNDHPWLVEPFIPVSGMAVLYGAAKSRKSFLALQLAMDLAAGRPWLGFATAPAKVFFLQLDTPRSLWQLRMKRLAKRGIVLAAGEESSRLILSDRVSAPSPFDIRFPSCFAWLRDRIGEYTPDLVIIDTLSKGHGGNEDSRTEMEMVIGQFQAATTPAALLLVTHGRKPKPDYDGGALHELRGSTAIVASADTILRLMRATKTKPPRIEYEGRATESGELLLHNEPSLFFSVDPNTHWKRLVSLVLMEEYPSARAAARDLHERAAAIGLIRSEDACRKALERGEIE